MSRPTAAVPLRAALYFMVAGTFLAAGSPASAEPQGDWWTGIPPECEPQSLPWPANLICRVRRKIEGRRLFVEETFGGNGRTCATCHSLDTGTFTPEEALERLVTDPADPLFVHDGLDDGIMGISRIIEHATVRITLPLPEGVYLKHDPEAMHVTVNRGTPTVMNTPALDPTVLMYDLRDRTLQDQALGAIRGHAQNTIEPTENQLDLIAEFQQLRFFSNGKLRRFAAGGPPPSLPEGETPAEKRGRRFFIDAPFDPPNKVGVCGLCHSGPMLNEANVFSPPLFGNPPGARAFNVGVSQRNVIGNPLYTFVIEDSLGPPVEVTSPDPGIILTNREQLEAEGHMPPPFVLEMLGLRRAFFAGVFKTPTLWGVKDTAPYFHDNSAKDLDALLEQYDFFFVTSEIAGRIELTAQDKEDIKAFLRLL